MASTHIQPFYLRKKLPELLLHYSKCSFQVEGIGFAQGVKVKSFNACRKLISQQIGHHTNMSQATATTIMDRLESRQLVQRIRSETDKRKVHATLTDAGRALLAQAPTPLQESFIQRFQALENWEQGLLLSSLQRISAMMNADGIDAAPVLSVRPLTEERA
jgi:DNA-binding MarR family transcriptional regulator